MKEEEEDENVRERQNPWEAEAVREKGLINVNPF